MATIAKGMITLVNVNDAYTVSATPNVCAIKADFDGTHPVLDDAYCDITVVRGDVKVPFTIKSTTPSHADIQYSIDGTDATKRLALTSIPVDALSGTVTVEVATEDEFIATVIFQYSVMREATMLDWIKDWENNKTTIGSTYLITPKLFVGKKVQSEADLSLLTGVYIGPDSDNGAGIYGYKEGVDIFHINENGGHIGGWDINNGGIQTSDGTLKILSEGSIISSDTNGNVIWGLYKSGEAIFANGNVKFHAGGHAEFSGTIKSSDGEIGGWYIGDGVLRSDMMCVDSNNNYIGVAAQGQPKEDGWDGSFHIGWVALYGGVYMHYMNSSEYGIRAYLPQTGIDGGEVQQHKTFSLGSENLIAGWNFDDTAIWIGNKLNTAQQYTSESGSITIGTNGLRGNKWYIDSNGDMSFMGGKIKFTATDDGGEIVGWKLNPSRFSTNNVALVSDGSVTGLYMSANADANFNSLASTALENYIDANGGIYMNINDTGAEFAAYDLNGKKLFKLKSDDVSSIAGWNFNNTLLYTGTPIADVTGFTASAGSISISPVGVFGYKWRFGVNGDGAIAGGNISWDMNGNVTFADSVKIGWNNLGGTIINSEGIFTGNINADNIVAGTIKTQLLNVQDIFAQGEITAQQIISPFVELDASATFSGFNIDIAYNSIFLPSGGGKYIFLTCDIAHSGRIITIHYSQTNNTSLPLYLFCGHTDARFLEFYKAQHSNRKIRCIQLVVGTTVQLMAIPNRPSTEVSDTENYVDWYLVGANSQMLMDNGIEFGYDDGTGTNESIGIACKDEMWQEYYNASINNSINK